MIIPLVQLGRGFGPVGTVEPPDSVDAPVITAVASSDSIVVTIDGEALATNTVLYKLSSASAWSAGGSRSGDGDVTISGLLPGSYNVIAYSSISGQYSTPGNMVRMFVTSESNIEAAVYQLLAADGTIDGIVDGKISPIQLAQRDSSPSVTYQQLTGSRNHTLVDTGNMVDAVFQINCYADDYGTGRNLSNAVRSLLDSYSGTVGTTVIQAIHMESEGDLFEMSESMTANKTFGKRLTFRVWFNE